MVLRREAGPLAWYVFTSAYLQFQGRSPFLLRHTSLPSISPPPRSLAGACCCRSACCLRLFFPRVGASLPKADFRAAKQLREGFMNKYCVLLRIRHSAFNYVLPWLGGPRVAGLRGEVPCAVAQIACPEAVNKASPAAEGKITFLEKPKKSSGTWHSAVGNSTST